ncbi:MAG: TRAP transporter substrate-binding protein DctP [Pseudomonadota bacterium]
MRFVKDIFSGKKGGFLLVALIAGLIALLAAPPAPAAKVHELKMVSFLPPDNAYMVGAKSFVDKVNTQMAGKVKIVWRGGPEVIASFDQPKAIASGVVDGAFTVEGYYTNLVPVAFLKVARGMTPWEARESGFYDLFNQQHQKPGLHYLGDFTGFSPFFFYLREKKKIERLSDFKGLIIRTGGIQRPFTEKLGGQPQDIPLGDVYTALQRGVVDGATAGLTSFGVQWIEQAPYLIEPGYYGESQPGAILLNLDRWKSLPPDIQKGLAEITKENEHVAYEAVKKQHDKAVDDVNAKGAKWIKFSPEEERQYVQMSRDAIFDFIGKQPGVTKELLDQFRGVMPGMK